MEEVACLLRHVGDVAGPNRDRQQHDVHGCETRDPERHEQGPRGPGLIALGTTGECATLSAPDYEAFVAAQTRFAAVAGVAEKLVELKVLSPRDHATLQEIFERDPTTLNAQGNDVGAQYRSAVFFHTPQQQAEAREVIANLSKAGLWRDPIVTEVTPASTFYIAEDYHQEYFARNPRQPYCSYVVQPKVAKFRKHFVEKLKKD